MALENTYGLTIGLNTLMFLPSVDGQQNSSSGIQAGDSEEGS